MTTLIIGMVLTMPVLACPPGTSCGNDSSVGKPVELTNEDKDKLIKTAQENDQVKKYREELEKEGFKQKNIEAYTLPVTLKDGSVTDIQVVTLQFESSNYETKEISYAYNTKTDETLVVTGAWSCAECLAIIVGGGIGCTGVCVSSGVLTMGATCVACIVAAATIALCPCYDCACAAGYSTACNSYNNICR